MTTRRHIVDTDAIVDPSHIMSGTPLAPIIDAAAAKTAMGLAPVATSGLYSDLTGQPALSAAQIQADYTQGSSGSIDFIKNKPANRSQSAVTRSFVTTTASTGYQISSSRDSSVNYNVTIATTATIASGASGIVFLEIAATNSTTPADWIEVARFTNGQVISLAITLQSVQTTAGQVGGYVPAGYYARLRTQNVTATPTFTYNSGQEVLL